MQQSGAVGLVIIAENDRRTLLIHRISFEDIYQRQGGEALSAKVTETLHPTVCPSSKFTINSKIVNAFWHLIKKMMTASWRSRLSTILTYFPNVLWPHFVYVDESCFYSIKGDF
jgi:hypothetical protein